MRSWNALRRSASVAYDSTIAIRGAGALRRFGLRAASRGGLGGRAFLRRHRRGDFAGAHAARSLNSVRELPAASAGSASPQTLRPFWFQQ
jgi:hypothetical protein